MVRNEDFRRRANLVICIIAWAGALLLTTWVVIDIDHRPYGTGVVVLVGIGITASLIRSRYKLAETISEVFHAGMLAGWNTPKREDAINQPQAEQEESPPAN